MLFLHLDKPPPYGACDNLQFNKDRDSDGGWKGSGWYRVMKKAGTELVHNRILAAGLCNAKKPGWVNGALPENSGETVAREYCFNWQRIPTDPDVVPERNDCDATTNIKITKCNHFYVYRLNNLDTEYNNNNTELSCTYRYCTT